MKAKILLLGVWLMLMGFSLPLFASSTPAANDGKWYYVKSQRFEAGTGPWWTFNASNQVVPGALTQTVAQKFTLVTTVEGKVTVKEFGGALLTAVDGDGLFDATGAINGWTITPNTIGGIAGFAFEGEESGLHQGNDGWGWRMTNGWYDLNDNCTFFFYEASADLDLNIAIDAATERKSAAVVGTSPNQTPQAAHDAYLAAINTAKTTLGSTDATAIQNAINALSAATTTFNNAKITPFATATPVADDGKWYYVKSQRYNAGGPWWTFGTKVIPGALTKTDNQKFTLVTAAAGKVTIKEFGGKKLTAAGGVFDATGAATGWTITPRTVDGVVGYNFPGENSGIHQGNAGYGWEVRADGWYRVDDFCTFFFYEAKEDVDLVMAIETAFLKLGSVSIGTTLGKTPQAAVDAYRAAIETAKLTLGSTDATAIQNATTALTNATNTFGMAKVQPVESSTQSAAIWYLIKNTNRGGKGATLYTNGWDAQMLCTTVANTVKADGTGTGAAAPALKYLFRFEQKSNADFQIVNAALPTGEILQTTAGGNSSQVIKYGPVANPVTTWKVNFIGNNATLGVDEVKFVSTGVGTDFHDSGSNALVSYTGGTGSASAWYVEKYTGDVSALFQTQYDALKAQYDAIADVDGNAVVPYSIGVETGQYAQVKFDALKVSYAAMVTEKEANGVSSDNMLTKFADVSAAIAAFKATRIQPSVAYAGTIVAGQKYTLKLVQPGSANDGFYLKNPRVDELAASKPATAFSANIDEATTVWKFTESATTGKYLITSTRIANEYVDELGRTRAASEYGDNEWGTKTLMQNTASYVDGTTLLIVKIDKNSNFLYSGTTEAATLSNSTNWSTFKLEQFIGTSVDQTASSEIGVKVVNRMLFVSGTTAKAQVYTITGSQVDATRALNAGIYIVKVDNKTFKVNVR